MKIPVETKPALWGAAGGTIALAIAGFTWGGCVTGSKAEADATHRANSAVVVALAPVCVEKFKHAAGASANLVVSTAARRAIDAVHQAEPYGATYRGQTFTVIFDAKKACANH